MRRRGQAVTGGAGRLPLHRACLSGGDSREGLMSPAAFVCTAAICVLLVLFAALAVLCLPVAQAAYRRKRRMVS